MTRATKHKLIVLPGAEQDVDFILAFLKSKSLPGANAWYARFQVALSSIQNDPLRFGVAPESSGHQRKVRQILFKTKRGRTYRALFVVVERTVYVIHVRGPNQRLLRQDELWPL